ncbi:Neuronal calcium sensor 2 [Caligus rogercresseyi]|uniref:Neuronal calcium sensor 2 n=1 Tax=Caligus rogercresseyi TaxID=217165 RepID=A0A7T8QW50_CALRO|nr:Neuronal calcium sensor 2 [Caligus rogercresseyi]
MGQKGSKDRLSKQDLDFLKTSTRYDENTIKEWYKGFKCDCPDGKLTPDSFMQIYSKCFPSGNANEFCDHVFRTFDMDKNGFIDLRSSFWPLTKNSTGLSGMNNIFKKNHLNMYDVDGNGHIDLVEMTKIVKSIYNMMDNFETPEARAQGIFNRMDVNADGKVTRQEFVRCCLEDQKLIELLTPHAS